MGRTVTAAAKTESQAGVARPIALVKLEFDSGSLRLWSGRGDITFNSEVYQGVGHLGELSAIEEGAEARAFGVAMKLSAIPASHISIALIEDVQGRPASVWLGFLDDNYVLVGDPVLVFKGRMDTIDVEIGDTATLFLTAESRLADWQRPRIRRYTAAQQEERFPGDKGFEFVSDTVEKEIVWGGTVAGGQGGGAVAAGQGSAGATARELGTSGQ